MRTVDDIFNILGGPAAVGRVIGKSTEHAATMRRRASIPVEYWPALIRAANAAGHSDVSAETMLAAHASQEAAA